MSAPLDIAALVKRLRDIAEVDDEQARGYPATMWQAADALEACASDVDDLRKWLDSNTTFYDVAADFDIEGPNVPVLAQVSKRIWYHATDDITSFPFSAAIDRARGET